jgi:hypothetical protein
MRNLRWLRFGLASIAIGGTATGALLVACGGDDSSVTPGTDSGTESDTSTGTDSGGPGTDSGPKTDSGQDSGPPPAKLIVINAVTDLGTTAYPPVAPGPLENLQNSLRVCFSSADKANPVDSDFSPAPISVSPSMVPPGSTQPYPAILNGTGGPFAGTGTALDGLTIRPYLFNAKRLAERGITGNDSSVPRCSRILPTLKTDAGVTADGGPGPAFVEGVDYWRTGDIPAGALKSGKSYILALTGCSGDSNALACGPNSDGGTRLPGDQNLRIMILELDTATKPAANEFGVQIVNAAPAWGTPYTPMLANSDGGTFAATPSGAAAPYNPAATAPSAMVKVIGLVTPTGFIQANGVGSAKVALNNSGGLPSVQALTTGNQSPDAGPIYVNGKAYTFVSVGDPIGTAGTLKQFHYLGFDNAFTP